MDIFGRYRREIEAAGDDVQAAAEARNAVLITVAADVARAYTDDRASQMRVSLIRDNMPHRNSKPSILSRSDSTAG